MSPIELFWTAKKGGKQENIKRGRQDILCGAQQIVLS